MENEVYAAAQRYQEEGYSVIPILSKSKSPAVKWKEYQIRKPTNEELQGWFEAGAHGIAILTGLISNVVVVDIDAAHGGWASAQELGLLRSDVTVVTGSGGGHYYYRGSYPYLRNFAGRWPGVDLRAEGGYVLAPPTLHPITGRPYTWQSVPRTELPAFLVVDQKAQRPISGIRSHEGQVSGSLKGRIYDLPPAVEGGRNNAAASLAGRLVSSSMPWDRCLQVLELWNSGNKPPLSQNEITSVLRSVMATHARNHAKD